MVQSLVILFNRETSSWDRLVPIEEIRNELFLRVICPVKKRQSSAVEIRRRSGKRQDILVLCVAGKRVRDCQPYLPLLRSEVFRRQYLCVRAFVFGDSCVFRNQVPACARSLLLHPIKPLLHFCAAETGGPVTALLALQFCQNQGRNFCHLFPQGLQHIKLDWWKIHRGRGRIFCKHNLAVLTDGYNAGFNSRGLQDRLDKLGTVEAVGQPGRWQVCGASQRAFIRYKGDPLLDALQGSLRVCIESPSKSSGGLGRKLDW